MTPIILTAKKVPISHSELTPKNGVTVTLYFLQCTASNKRPAGLATLDYKFCCACMAIIENDTIVGQPFIPCDLILKKKEAQSCVVIGLTGI